MDIGIGLPTTVPGISGAELISWARRGEELGFSSLGVIDRLMYDNYEPLISLAAAAGATSRIRLATTVLVAAYRGDQALLAKQLASLDQLSDGRLVVGVAAGAGAADYQASGTPYGRRGRRLDELLGELRRLWWGRAEAGLVPGPQCTNGGPPLLVGGHSDAAMRRAARYGDGWIAGGSSASGYDTLAGRARTAWREAGREGSPRMLAIAYVSLGSDVREAGEHYLGGYYAFAGPKAQLAVRSMIGDESQLREFAAGYEAAGCDELILIPCVTDLEQADRIAKAVLA